MQGSNTLTSLRKATTANVSRPTPLKIPESILLSSIAPMTSDRMPLSSTNPSPAGSNIEVNFSNPEDNDDDSNSSENAADSSMIGPNLSDATPIVIPSPSSTDGSTEGSIVYDTTIDCDGHLERIEGIIYCCIDCEDFYYCSYCFHDSKQRHFHARDRFYIMDNESEDERKVDDMIEDEDVIEDEEIIEDEDMIESEDMPPSPSDSDFEEEDNGDDDDDDEEL
jgi:hypothetical protein